MKQSLLIMIVVVLALVAADTANAIPRLQTYISGATYMSDFLGEQDTWIMQTQNSFELKVVAGWNGNKLDYDVMDTYLVIGTLKGETGSVTVNGVALTEFDNVAPFGISNDVFNAEPAGDMDLRFYHLGQLDNDQKNAYNYSPLGTGNARWGDEFCLDVDVEGFSYVHFDAAAEDLKGNIHTNSNSRDASFYGGGGGNGVPEPGTLTLLSTGLLSLIPILRRKKKNVE